MRAATIRRSSSRGRWRDRCRLGAYFILPPIKRSGSKVDSNSTTRRRPAFPNSGPASTVEAPNSPRARSHEIRLFLSFVHGFVGVSCADKCLGFDTVLARSAVPFVGEGLFVQKFRIYRKTA